MPEIAEIALTAEILEKYLKGKILKKIEFVTGRYTKKKPVGFDEFCGALPLKIMKVRSKGKFMWFEMQEVENQENIWYVWNTFGLTGMWSLRMDDKDFLPKHTRLVLGVKGGIKVYFSDMRNFGTFKFTQDREALEKKLKSLYPDFLKDEFDLARITKYKLPIVKILMDQGKVGSGLGNYLVAEILYRAKISPHKLGTELTDKNINDLIYWIKYMVKLTYMDNHIGYMVNLETESNQLNKKNYHPEIKLKDKTFKFLVYRKKTDPFGNKVKAETIIKTGTKKRTTYWVPAIQK